MMISQARVTVGWASGFLYALVANLASRKRFNILYLNARLSRKNVTRSLNDYTSCILLVSRVVLSLEGHCSLLRLMGDVQVLPHETQNTVYRYLIAISKLRLGILTEQGEGS